MQLLHMVTIEDLVPQEHFLRKLETALDLSFAYVPETHAKDTSKKIRAVFRAKGMSGARLSYGYLKGEDGKLVRDEETAPVVELIFQLAVEGNSPGKIARMLRERKNVTPGTADAERQELSRNRSQLHRAGHLDARHSP